MQHASSSWKHWRVPHSFCPAPRAPPTPQSISVVTTQNPLHDSRNPAAAGRTGPLHVPAGTIETGLAPELRVSTQIRAPGSRPRLQKRLLHAHRRARRPTTSAVQLRRHFARAGSSTPELATQAARHRRNDLAEINKRHAASRPGWWSKHPLLKQQAPVIGRAGSPDARRAGKTHQPGTLPNWNGIRRQAAGAGRSDPPCRG